ncbi:MAG: M15 family metallopeptidase [Methylococcaceae bacterium]|jgi:hypothetical protein
MSWPNQNYASMVDFYGKTGENQTSLMLPYPMRLAWDKSKTVHKITCHKKVAPSLGNILTKIYLHYDDDLMKVQEDRMDLFGGCLNVRRMRGGTAWSIHSWGTAIDLDPEHNALHMHRDIATMPEAIINIFVAEGWVSLGRSNNYDFMHFQAATF